MITKNWPYGPKILGSFYEGPILHSYMDWVIIYNYIYLFGLNTKKVN
jgi:hypothetical protein